MQASLWRRCIQHSARQTWMSREDVTPPSSAWTLCAPIPNTTGAKPTPLPPWCAPASPLAVLLPRPDLSPRSKWGSMASAATACDSRKTCVVAQVYSSSRAFVPSALHSSVRIVENKVSELGSPLITAVQTRSEQVLTSLDRKVSLPPGYAACTPGNRHLPTPAVLHQRPDAALETSKPDAGA